MTIERGIAALLMIVAFGLIFYAFVLWRGPIDPLNLAVFLAIWARMAQSAAQEVERKSGK